MTPPEKLQLKPTLNALPPELLPQAGGDAADAAVLELLHGRLVTAAEETGVLDVAYTVIDTPVGELLLAATDAGLVRVSFA